MKSIIVVLAIISILGYSCDMGGGGQNKNNNDQNMPDTAQKIIPDTSIEMPGVDTTSPDTSGDY